MVPEPHWSCSRKPKDTRNNLGQRLGHCIDRMDPAALQRKGRGNRKITRHLRVTGDFKPGGNSLPNSAFLEGVGNEQAAVRGQRVIAVPFPITVADAHLKSN